jgi:FkbM family methyltransferase
MTPRIGIALIARNEGRNLPGLLASITGAFDRAVLLDTGSKDNTIDVFLEWAQHEETDGFTYEVRDYEWRDDFAHARRTADAMLFEDAGISWSCWADADDHLHGATNLRQIAQQAPAQVGAYIFAYDYAHDADGKVICALKRERLVRRGAGTWAGMVHEAQLISDPVAHVDPDVCRWVHRRVDAPTGRNLRILRAWVKEEPENARVLQYLGTEHLARNRHRQAVGYFRRYLKLTGTWDEERAQVHRKLAISLIALGRFDEARATALEAYALLPRWPDSMLTLAQIAHHDGEHDKAAHWCDQVIALGVPETMLIINPLEYVVGPRALKAACLAATGDIDGAVELGEEAISVQPTHGPLLDQMPDWYAERKRRHTTGAVLALTQLLVEHDEQLNALAVLDAAPHYVHDHPDIVQARVMVRQRVSHATDTHEYALHYEDDDAEAGVEDRLIPAFCRALPRTNFLVEGLRDQAGEPDGFLRVPTRLGVFLTRSDDVMVDYLTSEPDGFEREIEDVLRDLVKPGMTVADIGANVGYFARLLGMLVGEAGEVHCVEPSPENARYLRLNVPQAVVYEVAALDKDRMVELHLHPQNSGDNRIYASPGLRGSVPVQARALEHVLPRLDFALIDTQGCDHLALKGLGAHRPDVAIVEMWPQGVGWAGHTEQAAYRAYKRMGYDWRVLGDTSEGHWNLLLTKETKA